MTRDVIELAREAGLLPDNSHPAPETHYMARKKKAVQHFAALVAARERERVAREFDRRAHPVWGFYDPEEPAQIIRALNTKGEGNDPITG